MRQKTGIYVTCKDQEVDFIVDFKSWEYQKDEELNFG